MRYDKPKVFSLILFFICLIFGLFLSEYILRLTGRLPFKYENNTNEKTPLHEFDPVLGWKNKEGKYLLKGYTPNSKSIKVTFESDGRRATGKKKSGGSARLATIGGSFTQGWGLSDNETYPWKLHSRFPMIEVSNYGTGGYGTYQSLLVLERLFAKPDPPEMVLYGFIEEHERRNVAHPDWLEVLTRFSHRGHVYVPYCTIDGEGRLERHCPKKYPEWPLREHLAIVNHFQKFYMKVKTKRRVSQMRTITEKLLLEMKKICKKNNAQFAVVVFQCSLEGKYHYMNFCRRNNITFINCAYALTPDKVVPGDRHPNGEMNTLWADGIGKAIGRTIRGLSMKN